jgi:Uma2 family endonuclease
MSEYVADEVDVRDDFSPFFEEESMPESTVHAALIHYLVEVLTWLFRGQLCAICENFAFFPPLEWPGPPVAPDIAIIKGVAVDPLTSWHVGQTGPAPQVVFEILSRETWKKDLEEKPLAYARMGIHEYFAYDPNPAPLAEATRHRLLGWRTDPLLSGMTPLVPDADGSLWSEELASFLLPDKQLLRLSDADHHLRLTGEEAEAQARWAAEQQARVQAQARWVAEQQARAEAEARRAAEQQARAEAEARRAAEQQLRQLLEKLRSQDIDPERL